MQVEKRYSSPAVLMHFCRLAMFDGVIDSRQVRAQRAGSSRSSSRSTRRSSEHDIEVTRLQEALRQRDEYYKVQQDNAAEFAQQLALLQVSLIRHHLAFVSFSNL
jgi:hypothetical protein